MRQPGYLSLTLLLAVSLTQTAAVAVPGGAARLAVSVSARPGSPAGIGPDDNPIGVPIETLSADATGAIRVDNVAAPHTDVAGSLNYAIISRANRSVVASGTMQKGQAGITQLLAIESAYSDADLMVVSGTAGIDNTALPDFKKLTSLLGASDPTTGMSDALTTQSAPFSVLGIPGGASGTAWLNVGLVPADLLPVAAVRAAAEGRYRRDAAVEHPHRPVRRDGRAVPAVRHRRDAGRHADQRHDVQWRRLPGGHPGPDVGLPRAGGRLGHAAQVLANQTLPTNGGPTPVADLQDAFARQLAADARMDGFQQFYANAQPPLVLMQSYGSPVGAAQAWQNAAETVDQLGGNKFAFYALDAQHPDYSLIGQVGGQPYADHRGQDRGSGPLSGVLTRTKNAMAFEPTTAGPPGAVS